MSLPDLSTLSSSAEIFSNPSNTLPQIRALHKALHAAVDDKRSRLRVQVGSSYRDLLGTADAIVEMKGDMDAVLETLGRMGGRCGRGVVGKKVAGLGEFVGEETERGVRMGAVGRARLVEGAALVVERLLRGRSDEGGSRGERLLTAAKLLVLSRLLVKSLGGGDVEGSVRSAVAAAKKSLEASRTRLLRIVDRVLQSATEKEQREDVLRALAAYSVATGSGARDTLYHFIRVRGEATKLTFDEDERTTSVDDVLVGMKLYTKTLLEVPALAPQKLSEALAALKKSPLIRDPALGNIEGLRLDIYERWCGDEIEYFTPFIRHDDLDRTQAREMLAGWAASGADVLLRGLEKTLLGMTEFKAVVDLRTSVLKLWVSEGGRVKGVDTSDLLDRFRRLVNKHMLALVEAKVSKLRLVGSEILSTIDSWHEAAAGDLKDFWDPESFDLELSNGAAHFTQDVVSRFYGRSDAVSKALSSYKSWYKVIDDVGLVVEQLKRQRWDNDVEEIEDEETIEQRQQLLSKDDPQALHEHLNTALVKAFESLNGELTASWSSGEDTLNAFPVGTYLLRVVRDIRSNLPALEAVKNFGLDLLPLLHKRLASNVAAQALALWSNSNRPRPGPRALWEGQPELPTSPSPDCLRFLRELSMTMSDAGMDLWYPALLTILKKEVNRSLYDLWLARIEALKGQVSVEQDIEKEDGQGTDGDAAATPGTEEVNDFEDAAGIKADKSNPERNKDVLIQWLFDITYLRCGLSLSHSNREAPEGLKELEDLVFGRAELDSHARQRITKTAQEYWKRTSLLFGLLA
jgi:hypothetical protein